MSSGHQNAADNLAILQAVEVEQKPLKPAGKPCPAWMPPNNKGEQSLF